jgi:quercetin dioxygenase-like cupin family protein
MTAEAGTAAHSAEPADEALWFLGTLARVKLDGPHTDGRVGLFEVTLPRGAAPPLHSHPQDETLYVLDGEVTAWVVPVELAEQGDTWVRDCARRCGPGAVVFARAGAPHTFHVDSDTARMLTISTPAGIEEYVRALAEPARWPWLQPPADGPRVSADRRAAADGDHGLVVHGRPPRLS